MVAAQGGSDQLEGGRTVDGAARSAKTSSAASLPPSALSACSGMVAAQGACGQSECAHAADGSARSALSARLAIAARGGRVAPSARSA